MTPPRARAYRFGERPKVSRCGRKHACRVAQEPGYFSLLKASGKLTKDEIHDLMMEAFLYVTDDRGMFMSY